MLLPDQLGSGRADLAARLDARLLILRSGEPGDRAGPAGLCDRHVPAAGRRPRACSPSRRSPRWSAGSFMARRCRRLDWIGALAIAAALVLVRLPRAGLAQPRPSSPVERDGPSRARSSNCAAALRSRSARMPCSTAGPQAAVDSAAAQLGIDPVQARLAMPKTQAGDDRPLHPGGRPRARGLVHAGAARRDEDPREDPRAGLAAAGDHGPGARSGAPRARDPRHAAEPAARAAHLVAHAPTSCGASPATPAPTSIITPSA